MSDLLKRLEPGKHGPKPGSADFTQVRKVPLQPEGVPLGVVFMGADLGALPWSGSRPRAGDTVAVVGLPGNRTVIGRLKPPLRDPAFFGRCSCRCPGNGGMIFYLTEVQGTSILIVVDGQSEEVLLYSTLPEVLDANGIAVDPSEPHDLYLVDGRQGSQNLIYDGQLQPDPAKQWYFMLKYVRAGDSYAFQTAEIMPGHPTENPFVDQVNSLTVIDGVCWIALASIPATIRKWSGLGFTDLPLTADGAPYQARLLGPIVQVGRPGPTSSYFILALLADGTTYEVVQFTGGGVVQQRLRDTQMFQPRALLTVCNRVTVFQSEGTNRSQPEDLAPDEGGGGGGGGEGGGEEN